MIIEGALGTISAIIRTVLALIRGDWEAAWQGIKDYFEEIWEVFMGLFQAWLPTMREVWAGIVGVVKGAVNNIIGYINRMIAAWNSISFRVPSISIPGITVPAPTLKNPFATKKIGGGSFGGQTFRVPQIPTIPKLAEGGIVTSPMLAQLAEREPEAVIPLSKLGGMAGGGTQVHIHAENLYGYEDFIDAVRQANLEGDRLGIGVA